jgi:hypothetical protein
VKVADVLTDDFIKRLCSDIQYRVGCADHERRSALEIAAIVRDELEFARQPTERFIIEIKAGSRSEAYSLLPEAIVSSRAFRVTYFPPDGKDV